MKYKSIGTRSGHKIFVRKRETAFDKNATLSNSSFGSFEGHKEMKTYEYAAFQKNVFKEKKIQKRRRRFLMLFTFIAVVLIILALPSLLEFIFGTEYLKLNY